jgi:tetratricopeptide (TPR) repeat protein
VTRTALVLAAVLATSARTYAQPKTPQQQPAPAPVAPSPDDLAKAKQAFDEGNALYKAGKLPEAIEKLKESFRLSRNAFLLYNIGHSYDQLGRKDLVLFYYRRFLANAPANAPMRDNVSKRATELEAEGIVEGVDDIGETTAAQPAPPTPASKFNKADFKHEPVFTVPPNHPIDIAAWVPQEAGYVVKLFYRASGEAAFTSKPMTWRNLELVARVPATKVTTGSIQYFIEVRDGAGNLLTRSGKATSPNLVNIENDAKPQYYADFVDEGGEVFVPIVVDDTPIVTPSPEGEGALLPRKVSAPTWIATGGAVALVGTSIVSYIMAGKQHDKLLLDANDCGAPPCQQYDHDYDDRLQTLGHRYDTVYKITLGVGVATTAFAGYLWYRDMTKVRRGPPPKPRDLNDPMAARRPRDREWVVAPIAGDRFAGATAAVRF